jgi:3-phenylpropionate/cinnamic acid dioxygenase small subunit
MSGVTDFATWQVLTGVLIEEAACLDEQRWDDWLALFTEDAVLWAPAWDAEHRLTTDPQSEVSLFYVEGRPALSDRVWRWSRGDSPASVPLPRTSHLIGSLRVLSCDGRQAELTARWHTQVYRSRRTWSYAGGYRHTLRLEDGHWRIARKTIVLTNDLLDTTLDLYHV